MGRARCRNVEMRDAVVTPGVVEEDDLGARGRPRGSGPRYSVTWRLPFR
jgi:hypothetical protein